MLPRPPQLPGLIWAAVLGLACHFAAPWLQAELEWWSFGGVSLAIFLGFIIGQFVTPSPATKPGLKYAEKTVLAFAIGFLGARLDGGVLAELGWSVALLLVVMMAVTIALGVGAARVLGLGPGLGWTLGVGTAVCGSSAIAAAAPFVDAKEEEVGLSVGVVNLLGTAGIFLLPALVGALSAGSEDAIVLTGGSLHAVGHVVAAGYTVSEEVGVGATAVKMGRIALLVPVVLFLALRQRRKSDANAQAPRGLHKLLPGYLLGFLALALLRTLGWLPEELAATFALAAKVLLTVAMAGIGLQLQLRELLRQGPAALAAGILVWFGQILLLVLGLRVLS